MKSLFSIIFIFSFLFCTSQNTIPKDWQGVNTGKYKLMYPSKWTYDSSKQMGTELIIFSSLENENDKFRENVNLIIQNLEGQNIDLDKYVQISEGQIKTMATESEIYKSERIVKQKESFHRIVYSATQGLFKLKFEQFYFIKNEKAFVLTLTTELEKFDLFEKTGEQILTSFELL